MKEQIESDVNRILKEKYGISHHVKVSNVITIGLNRTCSVEVGKGWVFDSIQYETLDKGVFKYHPETVAELMVDKIHRYKKYGK